MAYANRGGWSGKKKSGGARSDTKLTGLFKTQRKGLYVGSADGEYLDALIAKIKQAKAAGKGLAFFLWKNTYGDSPVFSLNVDIEKDKDARPKRRTIEPDDDLEFADDEPADEDDDLFGKD